jgi:two-component system, chemotaxis family, protein-glutamate methylesterase/glutaminase
VKLILVALAAESAQRSHELRRLLEAEGDIKVVAELRDAHQALGVVLDHTPDLLLLSSALLSSGGLDAIELIMAERPTGILLLEDRSITPDESNLQAAIRRGALQRDYVPSRIDPEYAVHLRTQVRRLSRVRVVRHILGRAGSAAQTPRRPQIDVGDGRSRFPDSVARTPAPRLVLPQPVIGKSRADVVRRPGQQIALVAIGASIGGPNVLADILRPLPRSLAAAIAIVQHLPPGFAQPFADYLNSHTELSVQVVDQPLSPRAGCVYLAADNCHLVSPRRGTLAPEDGPLVSGHRPSVDRLFSSVAQAYSDCAIGVVLTGLGSDGSDGLLVMRQRGAVTMAQAAETTTVDGMPRAARDSGAAEYWLSPMEISETLVVLCGSETASSGGAR